MLSPYQEEELENIRRAAERGKKMAEEQRVGPIAFLDSFIHIIDLVERIHNDDA